MTMSRAGAMLLLTMLMACGASGPPDAAPPVAPVAEAATPMLDPSRVAPAPASSPPPPPPPASAAAADAARSGSIAPVPRDATSAAVAAPVTGQRPGDIASSDLPAASAAPLPPAAPAPVARAPAAPRAVVVAPAAAASTTTPPPAVPVPSTATTGAGRTLAGRMELVAGPRQPLVPGEASDGVVYFLPGSPAAKPKPGRFTVVTHSKGFQPASLVVPVGSTIAFPNRDEILHNVYSSTPGSAFDLGTYGPGQTREATLAKAGLVLVNCNVHHGMRANVLVLETPYYARPTGDGRFELDGVPPGPGTLVFWHPRAAAVARPVVDASPGPVSVRLTAVRAPLGRD